MHKLLTPLVDRLNCNITGCKNEHRVTVSAILIASADGAAAKRRAPQLSSDEAAATSSVCCLSVLGSEKIYNKNHSV